MNSYRIVGNPPYTHAFEAESDADALAYCTRNFLSGKLELLFKDTWQPVEEVKAPPRPKGKKTILIDNLAAAESYAKSIWTERYERYDEVVLEVAPKRDHAKVLIKVAEALGLKDLGSAAVSIGTQRWWGHRTTLRVIAPRNEDDSDEPIWWWVGRLKKVTVNLTMKKAAS